MEFAVGEDGTAGEIQVAFNLYDYVNLVGRTDGLIDHSRIRVVECIRCIDIGHQRDFLVGTLYVIPPLQILVGLLDEVQRDVFEGRADAFHLTVFFVAEALSGQFLLAAV